MVKQTRAGFLVTLGALALSALSGCSGGAPPDSRFQGAYRSVYTIPTMGEAGSFNFSVERKGTMTGAFVDGTTNKAFAFNGVVTNSGTFTGEAVDDGTRFPMSGTLAPTGGDFEQTRGSSRMRGSFTVGGTLTTVTSEFRGIYSGVYNIADLQLDSQPVNGMVSFTVDSKGNLTGSMSRSIEGSTDTGLLLGLISGTGAFGATVQFRGGHTLPLTGTIVKTIDGSTQGNFTVAQGGRTYPALFSKSDSARAGSESTFRGSYRGTYGIPEQGESGNTSFTVDPSGTLLGFFSQSNNKPVATFKGSIQNDGSFSGTLSYPEGSPAPYNEPRPIVGKIGDAQANNSGNRAGDFVVTIGGINYSGNCQISIGGSEPDSLYRGAYGRSDAPESPGLTVFNGFPTPVTDGISLTVDKQGEFLGILGGVACNGRITNDGRIVGTLDGGYTISGKISRQGIIALDPSDRSKRITKDGVAGNLLLSKDGASYPAYIQAVGGNTEGAGAR